jgi:ubiquinone biosynthesis UbiH/UbiF/VisC/COQ6 family hydroxylase
MIFDVAIVGGGPVGASVARALGSTTLQVAVVEPRPAQQLPSAGLDRRVYALNRRSRRFLERLGVWPHLLPERVSPVLEMRVYGDDNSELQFSAYRSGVPELASIVEESNLRQALQASLSAQEDMTPFWGLECRTAEWDARLATLSLSDGQRIQARLVVAADGVSSMVRSAAGIAAQVREYGQTAVVANFKAAHSHRGTAYQWFLQKRGVLALLPLADNGVSMVWSAPDLDARGLLQATAEELARIVEQASGRMLGSLEPLTGAAGFPVRKMRAVRLIAPRLALVGDTAHNVHPLAGQGLNLGLSDAEALADVLCAPGMEKDSGAYSLLRRFERGRREDILAMETLTDGLQLLFASDLPGMMQLRSVGLRTVDRISPLKRILVKRALG